MNTASTTTTPSTSRGGHRRGVDRFRSRTAEHRSCTRLHEAAIAFDELLVAAHRNGLVNDPEVRGSLGAVVDAIASSITGCDSIAGHAPGTGPSGQVGSVLLDRAAARFSARVIGTELGRRPCPTPVLTALHAARHSLEAAGALTGVSDSQLVETEVDVVVFGLLRDRAHIESVLQALAERRPSVVRLVGTPVPVRSPGARELLDLEYAPSHRKQRGVRRGMPHVRLADAHLAWIARMLGEAGHRVVSTSTSTSPLRDHTGPATVIVVSSGIGAAFRARRLKRRIRRAGGSVVEE
jgi:hypothetical protein